MEITQEHMKKIASYLPSNCNWEFEIRNVELGICCRCESAQPTVPPLLKRVFATFFHR